MNIIQFWSFKVQILDGEKAACAMVIYSGTCCNIGGHSVQWLKEGGMIKSSYFVG
jgi:hypothetical protein